MRRIGIVFIVSMLIVSRLSGIGFEFAGYTGNSGTVDKPVLVGLDPSKPHFDYARHVTKNGNPFTDISLGPVYDDEKGIIYATAGFSTINAYTLDGRVVATYTLPKRYALVGWGRPRMTRAGNYIVIYTGNRHDKSIYKLPLNAPDGSVAEKIEAAGTDTRTISVSSKDSKCLVLKDGGQVYTLDPSNNRLEEFCNIGDIDVSILDWTPEGNILLKTPQTDIRKVTVNSGSCETTELLNKVGGSAWTIVGDYIWSCGGGTINRYSYPELAPDPGVVFGGASGSFLGVVEMNREMDSSYGIVQIKDGLFVLTSGASQVIHLAEWDDTRKKLSLVRRIGAIPWVNTLLVDGSGNVLINRFVWKWDDDSLSPLTDNYSGYFYESVDLGNNLVLNFGLGYDYTKKCSIFISKASWLDKCGKAEESWLPSFKILEEPIGAVAYKIGDRQYALIVDASGQAIACPVQSNGGIAKGSQIDATIKLKTPATRFSDIAGINDSTILAAVDGKIVGLKLVDGNWVEQGRWFKSFSPDCKVAVDGGKVFITEKDKNLLSVYSMNGKTLLGKLTIDTPTDISVNGDRLAVYEEKNQRVSKYNLILEK